MKWLVNVTMVLLSAGSVAAAQLPPATRLEVRSFAGVYVPLGSQGRDFNPAPVFGAQAALGLTSHFHVVGSLAMVRSRSSIDGLTSGVAYIWPHDVGVEINLTRRSSPSWRPRPFVGGGYGARAYEFPDAGVDYSLCASGYGAVGAEWERRVFAMRLENRGYFTCFRSPVTSTRAARADLLFLFGLAYHLN
jgi:hypothetical protein